MPVYDYKCNRQECLHRWDEYRARMDQADPAGPCPMCLHMETERTMGSISDWVFKTDGFYRTDYQISRRIKRVYKEPGEP